MRELKIEIGSEFRGPDSDDYPVVWVDHSNWMGRIPFRLSRCHELRWWQFDHRRYDAFREPMRNLADFNSPYWPICRYLRRAVHA